MGFRISRSIMVDPDLMEQVRVKAKRASKTVPDLFEMWMREFLLDRPVNVVTRPPALPTWLKPVHVNGELGEKIARCRTEIVARGIIPVEDISE